MKQLQKQAKKISMFIFAIALLGCTDVESILPTVTSNFTYTINEDTGTVTFINLSEDARTYAWDFGDGTSSTEINPIKNYAVSDTYTVMLTASNDAGGSDSAASDIIVTITADPPPGGGEDPEVATSLPIDFESNETLSGVFEEGDGVTGTPIANPDQSGINTSDTVYEFNKATGAAWYSGLFQIFPSDIDLSTTQALTVKIWSPKADINVRMQLEKEDGSGGPTVFLDQTLATANEWVSLTFDFSGVINTSDAYDKFVIFPEFDATNEPAGDGSVYYLDDIEQGGGSTGGGDPTLATSFPIEFEANETLSGVFEEGDGVTGTPITNPDQSGINTSATVYEFTKATGAAWYSGLFHIFPSDIDLSTTQAFTFKIWSPKAGINVRLQLEKEGGGPVTYQLDQTLATADEWVSLTFDFTGIVDPADGYDKIVIFPDFDATNEPAGDGSVYYIDDIEQGGGSTGGGCTDTALELPIDFDCSTITYDFVTFNGASYSVVDNPDVSGVNDVASKVGEIVNIGGAFEGGAFTLDTPVDFTTDKAITMKFYSTVGVPVLLKFEGAGAPIETTATHGGTGWEQLTFEFTSSDQFTTLVLFVDGPGTTAGTFYMDDIEQTAAAGGGGGTPATFPLDFEDGALIFNAFEGATVAVIDNPQTTGNPSSKVMELVKPAGVPFYAGINSEPSVNGPVIDLANGLAFNVKIWSPKAGINVRMRLEQEPGVTDPPAYEIFQTLGNANEWVTLTFDFSTTAATSSNTYTRLVLNTDWDTDPAAGETYYIDDIEQVVPAPPAALELPIDFDNSSLTYDFVTFNGASYSVVDNPDLSGVNTVASKVGQIVNIGGAYEGGAFTLDTPVDFGTDKDITMKFYSTVGVPVLLKFEGAGAPVETTATHGGTGWEQLTFSFTTSDQFGTLVLFVDGPGATAGTFYMDDIEQVAGPPPPAALELPIDFDNSSLTYDFVTFNGASYSVVNNPDLSGVNNVASMVGEIVNVGGAYEGGAFTLDTPVDFGTDKDITMKFYSTVGVPVLLKFEGAGAPVETTATHGGTGWEQLTFSFTTSDQFGTLVLFVDGPGTTAGTFYMDDIEQVAGGGGGGGGGGTAATFPLDFEDDVLFFNAFEGATTAVIDNPQTTGNTSSKVLELVKPVGVPFYAGINSDQALNGPSIDLANGLIFTVQVWSPKAGINVRMRLEQEPGVTQPPAYEIFQTLGNANEWVTLTFDFSTTPATSSDAYTRMVLNTDWDTDPAAGEIFYIDNIIQQ